MVICLKRGADLHMAQIGFTFLVPTDLGSPGKRAVKRVCVCVCEEKISNTAEMTG